MTGFFSALILICTNATGEVVCETKHLPEFFTTQRLCMREITEYDRTNYDSLMRETKYIISGVCNSWRIQQGKVDNQYTARESVNVYSVTIAGRYRPTLTSQFGEE